MHEIHVNVNHALPAVVDALLEGGEREDSRNGPVISVPEPFILSTLCPEERVLLCPVRRANPFLFLIDGLSILTDFNSVALFTKFAKRFADCSDDGIRFHGHYGERLAPQIPKALEMLTSDPTTRRVHLTIWDAAKDLGTKTKDVPCNIGVIPRIVNRPMPLEDNTEVQARFLDLTVLNRSNDLFWGMLGANIVQFSFLQEYMAGCLGAQIGTLHQVSMNLHAYTDFGPGTVLPKKDTDVWENPFTVPEEGSYPPVFPMDVTNIRKELKSLFIDIANEDTPDGFKNSFINEVVIPMLRSWKDKSSEPLKDHPDCDWFQAARLWWGK